MSPRETLSREVEEQVDIVVGWVRDLQDKTTPEEARRQMQNHILERLLKGQAMSRMQVIEAARAGNPDAEYALRVLAVELMSRREEMPTELLEFLMSITHPGWQPPPRKRSVTEEYMRQIGTACLIDRAKMEWPELVLVHNRATRRAGTGRPSICFLICEGLNRCGGNITETRVYNAYNEWRNGTFVKRLSATIPEI
jgi:hypothetical protein